MQGVRLWERKTELSVKRWRSWKQKFSELSTFDMLTGDTSKLAKETAETMDWIENTTSDKVNTSFGSLGLNVVG